MSLRFYYAFSRFRCLPCHVGFSFHFRRYFSFDTFAAIRDAVFERFFIERRCHYFAALDIFIAAITIRLMPTSFTPGHSTPRRCYYVICRRFQYYFHI